MQRTSALAAILSLALSPLATAQIEYASTVVSYNQGPGAQLTDPSLLLGGPQGTVGTHVLSLGLGGDVTVGFNVTLTDGPAPTSSSTRTPSSSRA